MPAAMIYCSCPASVGFMKQYTGYLFNPRDVSQINVFGEVEPLLLHFLVVCD